MNKFFRIKFNDFLCPDCGQKLYIPDIKKILHSQYEPNTDENGYLTIITAKCECGNRYKIYCDCHEYDDKITVCVKKIVKLLLYKSKTEKEVC